MAAIAEQLSGIVLELRANRMLADALSQRCVVFRFTGGTIPPPVWNTRRVTSCLTFSSAAKCIAEEDVASYLALLGKATDLQIEVASAAGPRTLRDRFAIIDAFELAMSKILALGSHLETVAKQSLDLEDSVSSIH